MMSAFGEIKNFAVFFKRDGMMGLTFPNAFRGQRARRTPGSARREGPFTRHDAGSAWFTIRIS
jgi:hypothetical protein